MCGRYELIDGQRIFVRFRVPPPPPPHPTTTADPATAAPLADNRDVRPTQQVPVLLTDHILTRMQWGIIPAWSSSKPNASSTVSTTSAKPLINARAEGIETKPTFRRLLPQQRCLIPASAFFEWQAQAGAALPAGGSNSGRSSGRSAKGAKIKYRIARQDEDLFAFAGLYSVTPTSSGNGGEIHTCTIITTTPNAVVAPIHNRMPVILLPDDEDRWLDPDLTEPYEVMRLLRPYPDHLLEARPA